MKRILIAGLLTVLMSTSVNAGAVELERLIERVDHLHSALMERNFSINEKLLHQVLDVYTDIRREAPNKKKKKLPPFPETREDFQRLAFELNLIKSDLSAERYKALTLGY